MRNFDLTPLYRSTVGFDRFGSMLDQLLSGDAPTPSFTTPATASSGWLSPNPTTASRGS